VLTHLYLVNQWQTWAIILAVVLLLFGAAKLPALSKSLGQSIKVFRKEIKSDDNVPADATEPDTKPSDATKE
jgi:sec-independent protein translocase protein TatA